MWGKGGQQVPVLFGDNEDQAIWAQSVEEDPQIENGIAAALGSNHIPLHLLCKVHTVETLNISNINVLASLESYLKFREAPESINVCVKSFVRGKKSVVLYAIKSIDNFASHDKSSSVTNQGEFIMSFSGKTKSSTYCYTKNSVLPNLWLLLYLNTWCYALYPNGFFNADQTLPAEEKELQCKQICVTLWNEAETKTWDIGTEIFSDEFSVENIHRVTKRSNLKWWYPTGSDIAVVKPNQILHGVVDGVWNILSNRNSEFLLWNHETMLKKFLEAT